MFIETETGDFINADHIARAEALPPRNGIAQGFAVTLSSGQRASVLISSVVMDDLRGTIVPAPPGFVVVEAFLPQPGDADRTVRLDTPRPVIAFRVFETGTRPTPITADGQVGTGGNAHFAVRGPEGPWVGVEEEYATPAEFKTVLERFVADRRARVAA
jgi:hypothetical protein